MPSTTSASPPDGPRATADGDPDATTTGSDLLLYEPAEPPPPRRPLSRRQRHRLTIAIAIAAGLVATIAPASFTGTTAIDAVERALVVGLVTFVGAHAHRWTWFVAGALVAVPARGASLVLVCLGLVTAVFFTRTRRRSRPAGAAAVGFLANAALWFPGDVLPTGAAHGLALVAALLVVSSGYGEVGRRHRRRVRAAGLGLALVLLVGLAATAYLAFSARNEFQQGTSSARQALDSVRSGESDDAQSELAEAQELLGRANDRFDGPLAAPMRLVPGVAQQADAVETALEEALAVSEAADDLLANDYDQLRYDGQIDLATVSGLVPQADRVAASLARADRRLAALQTRTLVPPLRSRVDEFADQVDEARDDADLAADLLQVAPGLLGADGQRHYLVVFMQPAELRGAGGFVGNFVELSASEGDVDLARSGRITELLLAAPPGQRTITGPPDYLDRYGRLRPQDNLQDVTFSPNWPSDAAVYAELYPQSGGRPVDAVVGVDPTGLAGLLELTGPVPVPGFPGIELTAENAVDALTRQQYLLFGNDSERREDFLEAAVRATFDQLTEADLPAPREIGDALGDVVRGRHIQLWSPTTVERRLFEQLDADGEVAVPQGQDGLAVVQQNTANNKLDAYLQRDVRYRATVDPSDATIDATVTIELTNEVPTINLPRDVVGNNRGVPVGTNLSSLAVYTPHTVVEATIDGRSVKLAPDGELGLQVWDVPLVAIPPGRTVTIVMELRGTLDLSSAYAFRYFPQPQALPEEFRADIRVREGSFVDANGQNGLAAAGPAEAAVELRSAVRP